MPSGMKDLRISTVQFENRSGDKSYNLSRIAHFAKEAARQGSDIVAFHECSVTGYTFARNLNKKQMLELSEKVPDGNSTKELIRLASEYKIVILAGLFEKDEDDRIYKTYVCVDGNGLVAKYHKLHPFVNKHICQVIDIVFSNCTDGSAEYLYVMTITFRRM